MIIFTERDLNRKELFPAAGLVKEIRLIIMFDYSLCTALYESYQCPEKHLSSFMVSLLSYIYTYN